MQKVLAIVGPTAVGKTSLSIEVAKRWNGEIISGDSMQVYQRLDVGTAKITPAEMQGVPHHLINVRKVQERFSAADFKEAAANLIKEISDRKKLPIIVGGTGFYLQALLNDLQLGTTNEDRQKIEAVRTTLNQKSDEELRQRLQEVDPESYAEIDLNNRRRVIRALEVFQTTGQKFSAQPKAQSDPVYDALLIGLNTERSKLYERINQRVELMLAQGLEDEARWLFKQPGVVQATKGIGYREWPAYFAGEQSYAATVAQIQKDSRHYAKRQLTWFRNQMDVNWFDIIQTPAEKQVINQRIEEWLAK